MSTTNGSSNTLGNASLGLGILSAAAVFCLGLTALAGAQQGWVGIVGVPLWVCGATSAFLGLLALILGGIGIFTAAGRNRVTAIAGAALGLLGICLFVAILAALGG